MRSNTRKLYTALMAGMATAYGVDSMAHQFSVDIPQETTLNDKVQESSAFLDMINMTGVTDTQGQALELGVDGLLAKRTNTDTNDRSPADLGGPSGSKWATAFTEFDVGIKYQTLDTWARYKDFHQRYMKAVYKAIALNRMSIGFNGTSVAAETDPGNNPLGQDVNKGWLQVLKEQNPEHYIDGANIYLHPDMPEGQGYKTLDGLVADVFNAIPIEHRTGQEVAIIGSSLLAYDSNKVYNDHGTTPSEKKDVAQMLNSYGGLRALQIPKFPTMGLMVTDPKNLHLYFQENGTRRSTEEESKRSRIVDYISSNDAYAIGNVKAIAAVDASKVLLQLPVE